MAIRTNHITLSNLRKQSLQTRACHTQRDIKRFRIRVSVIEVHAARWENATTIHARLSFCNTNQLSLQLLPVNRDF